MTTMNLRHPKRTLETANETKEFAPAQNHSCEFEISQADKTIKLKRVTPKSSFKIQLKPFLNTNPQDDLKISLSGLLNDGKSQLKRSLEEVYAQGDTGASNSRYNTRYKSGQKIKKSKETTIKIRKCVKSNLEEDNKIQTEEQDSQPQEPQVIGVPIPIADEPYKSNLKNLSRCNTKTDKKLPSPPVKAPLYIQKLYERLASGDDEKFKKNFYSSFKDEKQKGKRKLFDFPQLPVNFELPPPENLRKDFTYDLDIITNQNQKERIKVSFQPGKVEAFSEIPNPMDKESRDSFFADFNFTMDYRSGYAPIDVQAKQEKDFTYKNHFIKKKQSCANNRLKRVCGVSYVKKLECHQLNVEHIFAKLNPLVFQGSTGCVRLTEYQALMKQATDKIFQEAPGCYFIVTMLEAEDESLMREYLYFPERRMRLTKGKVYLVHSLDALWFFFKDKHFICVHLVYDDKDFIKKSEISELSLHEVEKALMKSNIQIGFLCKKGLSGKKSFLKTFTEGLNREELGVDSDSEDEAPNQTLEELEKEKAKAKATEGFISPKKKKKAETKELKEKEKFERKEKREQEKREKQEQKLKERREKIMKLKSTKREKKEPTLTDKQKHFFDKCKLKLEHEQAFAPGILREIFSNVDDIMQPYLKMLFVKGFTYSLKSNEANQTTVATPSIVPNDSTDQVTVDQTPRSHDENRFEMMSGLATPSKIAKDDELLERPRRSHEDHISQEKLEDMSENKENRVPKMQVETAKEEIKEVIEPDQEIKTDELNVMKKQTQLETGTKVQNDQIKHSPLQEFIKDIKKEPGKNMVTMSTRVELYTHEDSWKSADEHTKNLLYTFILHLTDLMTEKFRNWTLKRSEIAKANTAVLFSDLHQEIDLYEFDASTLENNMEEMPLDPVNLKWHFNPEIRVSDALETLEVEPTSKSKKYCKNLKSVSLVDLQGLNNLQKETTSLSLPLYTINTRDSFAFDLIEKRVEIEVCGRKVLKTDYYFDPVAYPSNFKTFFDKFPDLHVGVTTYNNFFSHEELLKIEEKCYETERNFFDNHFLPMTGQMTATNDKVRRTKFFFGARYMWTKQQLSEPHSMVGAGIRTDVSERPRWMKDLVEEPLVQAGIMEKNFINSIAMNVYHDGREGIAQHFDDAVRFKQPIYSLRIFSDSRLSFGSQFYGFCNGAFCIPMPRGCITILAEESYAANGIKHCVRPCDMTGKSAALILRQMHHKVFNEAQLYNEFVDFPTWFSTLSIKDNAVSYNDQKRLEADDLLKNKKKPEE